MRKDHKASTSFTAAPLTLTEITEGKSIVVVLGHGGVGKTTVAAALSAMAASRGRRVLAVTVDPSNRLKTSLGLTGRPGVEERVSLDGLGRGDGHGGGSLHAMVLDTATEMDRLLERLAPSEETRIRIRKNVFFRKAAAYMAGTHEYMAMERILEALESDRYDLVVLDTPPERHALDFLDAPGRLDALLSSDIFRVFVSASSGLSRLGLEAIRWQSIVLRGISRFTGKETFLAILDFVLAFQPMFEGFRQRAGRVRSWFTGPRCATIVVVRPGTRCAGETGAVVEALEGRGITPAAVVANRVHTWPPPGSRTDADTRVDRGVLMEAILSDPALSLLDPEAAKDLAGQTAALAESYEGLASEDCGHIESLKSEMKGIPVFEVPLLRGEVRDLDGLASFAEVIRRSS